MKSTEEVMRIGKMIAKGKCTRFSNSPNQFGKEMSKDQLGEFVCGY